MEKTREIKGFTEYKTNMRAVSDGINLLGRHAWMLLKACSPLMVLMSLLSAWTTVSVLADMNQILTTDISITGVPHASLLPSLLLMVVEVIALAQFYGLFQGYVQNGFIPQVNLVSVWKLTGRTLKNSTLIVCLWIVFVSSVYAALVLYLQVLSNYTLIITLPVGFFLTLWHMNLLADFHVQDGALVNALPRSLKVTLRGLFSFLLVFILLSIVAFVVSLIITVPMVVSGVISTEASFSVAMGDGADLPGYFNTVCFIFSAIAGYLMLIVSALLLSSWTMVYGAVSHRSSKKFQSSLSKD